MLKVPQNQETNRQVTIIQLEFSLGPVLYSMPEIHVESVCHGTAMLTRSLDRAASVLQTDNAADSDICL